MTFHNFIVFLGQALPVLLRTCWNRRSWKLIIRLLQDLHPCLVIVLFGTGPLHHDVASLLT